MIFFIIRALFKRLIWLGIGFIIGVLVGLALYSFFS